ncbi:MAG: hypothetical protein H3C43_00715 [Leptonema sp. (in: Bacteria)]|nr:hypothetical protein [Leptonema sp. (in: bacteria)]
MLLTKPPYRIAAHQLPDLKRHGDFFLELPDRSALLTYEMDGVLLYLIENDPARMYLMTNDNDLFGEVKSRFPVYRSIQHVMIACNAKSMRKVALKPKPDHRKMYMNYSGTVETRGTLQQFQSGRLDGFLFGDENALIVVQF